MSAANTGGRAGTQGRPPPADRLEPRRSGRRQGSCARAGFTLPDAVTATVLVTMLAAGIYGVLVSAQKLNYAAAQHVAAFDLAKETLEQMRGVPYETVTASAFPCGTVLLTCLGGSHREPLYATRSCAISSVANPAGKAITVRVQWTFNDKACDEFAFGVIYKKQ